MATIQGNLVTMLFIDHIFHDIITIVVLLTLQIVK